MATSLRFALPGTDRTSFELGGRRIFREAGRLTLENGTLAGADLDLTTAIRVMVEEVGVPTAAALEAASTIPTGLIGASVSGLNKERPYLSGLIRISKDLRAVSAIV